MKRIEAALLLVIGILLLTAVPAAGTGSSSGDIVFESDRSGRLDIWTMRPDGSGAKKLTDDKVDDLFPEWSPNGERIAWARGAAPSAREIWVMNADGTGKRQVTFNAFDDLDPVWSPDSSQLAFRSIRDGNRDVYVVNVDGTGERRLTADPAYDFAPDWSPDGTRIAFTSARSGFFAIYSMSAVDGSDVRQLTPDSLNAGIARYSPDGAKVIFADERCDGCVVQSDLWVVNTDASGLRRVTNTPENETPEAWSLDGTRVLADVAKLNGVGLHKSDVAVVTVATGAVVNLTNTGGSNEGHPDWLS